VSVAESGDKATIKGTLTLAGRSKALTVEARRDGARWVSEVVLHQPDFGVKPYTAMLGTLKIKPDVRVRVSLPADRIALNAGVS
jgi:polyisoprenoid-binding protein YceI